MYRYSVLNCYTIQYVIQANCLASATMQEAMFNMHLIGVNNFDGEGPLFMGVPGAVQMTHVLLKNQHFCERFFTELMTDNHVRIWSSSVENYPMSISTISLLAEAVIVSQSEAVKRVSNIVIENIGLM